MMGYRAFLQQILDTAFVPDTTDFTLPYLEARKKAQRGNTI